MLLTKHHYQLAAVECKADVGQRLTVDSAGEVVRFDFNRGEYFPIEVSGANKIAKGLTDLLNSFDGQYQFSFQLLVDGKIKAVFDHKSARDAAGMFSRAAHDSRMFAKVA